MDHGIRQGIGAGGKASAGVDGQVSIGQGLAIKQQWHVECYGRDGKLKWEDRFANLVVNEGLTLMLEEFYNGSAYSAAHFVGLTDSTPTFAAADTMASHAGWVEEIGYQSGEGSPSANVRHAYLPAAAASQSIDNSASKAEFLIGVAATIGGAFLSTDSAKGGSAGTLIGGNVFTGGDRSLSNGDTLNVTVTASMTSS